MNNDRNEDEIIDNQCRSCVNWFRAVDLDQMSWGYGYCKRQPPSLSEKASEVHQRLFGDAGRLIGIFPLTSETNWCGEYDQNPLNIYTERLCELDIVTDPSVWTVHFDTEESRSKLFEHIEDLQDRGVITVGDWLSLGNDQPRLIPNLGYASIRTLNRICSIAIRRIKNN